jgi:hypothetical protein
MSAKPPDRLQAVSNVTSFLTSANTAPKSDTGGRPADPMVLVLRGLAEAPRSLPQLVRQTGMGPSEIAPILDKLEAMRLVRRVEEPERLMFNIEREGMAMIEAST